MNQGTTTVVSPARRWTLALDESGAFEGRLGPQAHDERGGWVVGGLLLPGGAEETHDGLEAFRRWCRGEGGLGWPVHASELSPAQRQSLVAAAGEAARERGGIWLFVVARARGAARAGDLGRYVRMFGATVDLAGRLVAALGGAELDACPAQRSLPLDAETLAEATSRGVLTPTGPGGDGRPRGRAMLAAETRHALEALGREPAGALGAWPQLHAVDVEIAAQPSAHPALALADVGCNRVYGGLWADATSALGDRLRPLERAPVFVVELDALRKLRALDRALRESPADLVSATKILAGLHADARASSAAGGNTETFPAAADGAAAAAQLLWEQALVRLAQAGSFSDLALRTAANAEADLALKRGAYEGTWLALEAAWLGSGPLARAVRAESRDPFLAARLWRLCLECANHRGDVAAAAEAERAFDRVRATSASYRLLAEELLVRNLAVVAAQNRLPAEPEATADILANLTESTAHLEAALDHEGQMMSLAPAVTETAVAGVQAGEAAAHERQLWQSLGVGAPQSGLPDRERGMGLGTVARSLGFLGRLDEACAHAMAARRHFVESPADLRFNAAVLAGLLLEMARLGPLDDQKQRALEATLALSGAARFLGIGKARDLRLDAGERFAFDLALRALLWTSPSSPKRPLLAVLREEDVAVHLGFHELRSHPTELVARHAAELLRRHDGTTAASERWFRLSIGICQEAPAGTTLRRLGPFTERLASDPAFTGEGPAGSVSNPTFEYR